MKGKTPYENMIHNLILTGVIFLAQIALASPYGWVSQGPASSHETVSFQIYLKHSEFSDYVPDNLKTVAERLAYLREQAAPPDKDLSQVRNWLHAHHADCTENWDSFDCRAISISTAEQLFGITLHQYTHPHRIGTLVATEAELHMPACINLVAGLRLFDPNNKPRHGGGAYRKHKHQ